MSEALVGTRGCSGFGGVVNALPDTKSNKAIQANCGQGDISSLQFRRLVFV